MKSPNLLAVSGLALSAFLVAMPAMAQNNHVDANGMPTATPLYTPTGAVKDAQLTSKCATLRRAQVSVS